MFSLSARVVSASARKFGRGGVGFWGCVGFAELAAIALIKNGSLSNFRVYTGNNVTTYNFQKNV